MTAHARIIVTLEGMPYAAWEADETGDSIGADDLAELIVGLAADAADSLHHSSHRAGVHTAAPNPQCADCRVGVET